VYISGQQQDVFQAAGGYGTYGVDVSVFAGDEISLEFLIPEGSSYILDVFGFYPIPEPSTSFLLILGSVSLLVVRRKRFPGSWSEWPSGSIWVRCSRTRSKAA
jgi:hypothetical protein